MIATDSFDEIVAALYVTVADGGAWPQALAAIRAAFDCAIVDLNTINEGRRRSLSTDPVTSDEWMRHWASVNPIDATNVRPGTVALARDVIDHERLVATAYYNEFLLPADIPQIMMVRARPGLINLLRGRRQPQFAEAELGFARRLSGHVVNALRAAAVLGWKSWTDLTASLEAAPDGMILVDAGGAILHMNRSARALTEARDGIIVSGRQLDAAFGGDAKRLREAIWRATAGPAPHVGAMLSIERPSCGRPLIASITPLAEQIVDIGVPSPRALIAVLDPQRAAVSPAADLQRLFGLTRRETDIAQALGEGLPIAEVAARCGVTLATARNYLARVLRKTQLNRQSELVLLLNGLARLAEAGRRRS